MGMDVYGTAPTAEVGEYFRRSVWGWHPLWELVENLVPEIAVHVEHGHSNDGDGLDGDLSRDLANRLRELLKDGTVKAYVQARDEWLASLPMEVCEYCNGTGVRTDEVGRELRMPEKGYCNACANEPEPGKRRPFAAWYSLYVDDVEEFVPFLEACGGFEIW